MTSTPELGVFSPVAADGATGFHLGMRDRDHLPHLRTVWIELPISFVTVCTSRRRRVLAAEAPATVLVESWRSTARIHIWAVGRYVVMPDHVHFFASPDSAAKPLAGFVRDWKKWTTHRLQDSLGIAPPLWQPEYFDHVLRSPPSYDEKWKYVLENPIRAGLVGRSEDWKYAGECDRLGM